MCRFGSGLWVREFYNAAQHSPFSQLLFLDLRAVFLHFSDMWCDMKFEIPLHSTSIRDVSMVTDNF